MLEKVKAERDRERQGHPCRLGSRDDARGEREEGYDPKPGRIVRLSRRRSPRLPVAGNGSARSPFPLPPPPPSSAERYAWGWGERDVGDKRDGAGGKQDDA